MALTALVPTSIELDLAPVEDVRWIAYDPTVPIPDDHADAEVLVAWANTPGQLADCAARLTGLRLVQSLAAGVDQALAAGFREDVAICSGVGLHNGPVAEHALALALALVRDVPGLVRAQQDHRWADEHGWAHASAPAQGRRRVTSLRAARAVIWGFGEIGQTLAPLLAALGAEVIGVATSEGERAGFPCHSAGRLAEILPTTDLLVMILPGTPGNRHALDAERIESLPPHALVVNVGRGSTLDEKALIDALANGGLAGAALDVFETEPLPPDSPLWSRPEVLISPHAAGGRPLGAARRIETNVRALLAGDELAHRVR